MLAVHLHLDRWHRLMAAEAAGTQIIQLTAVGEEAVVYLRDKPQQAMRWFLVALPTLRHITAGLFKDQAAVVLAGRILSTHLPENPRYRQLMVEEREQALIALQQPVCKGQIVFMGVLAVAHPGHRRPVLVVRLSSEEAADQETKQVLQVVGRSPVVVVVAPGLVHLQGLAAMVCAVSGE